MASAFYLSGGASLPATPLRNGEVLCETEMNLGFQISHKVRRRTDHEGLEGE